MFATIQALIAPLAAVAGAHAAALTARAVRFAVLAIAATLFGIGALFFLSVGIVFALTPVVGAAWAMLIMAVIWALLAAACILAASRLRSRPRVAPVAPPAPPPSAGQVPPRPRPGRQISGSAPLIALGALIAGILAGRR